MFKTISNNKIAIFLLTLLTGYYNYYSFLNFSILYIYYNGSKRKLVEKRIR